MNAVFHWGFVLVLFSALAISVVYRARARKLGGTIARREEGTVAVLLRAVLAMPLFLSYLAYAIHPAWMQWSSVPLPDWLRWLGLAIGLASLPFLLWVFRSIGTNISETILTKTDHKLVRAGPYRWIRHPLYAGALAAFFSLGCVAANAFMLGIVLLAAGLFSAVVIPREEAHLIAKFGEDYITYRRTTGGLFPKIIGQP